MGSRTLLRKLAAMLPLQVLPLDIAVRSAQGLASHLARLLFIRDWQLEARGRPQFFKHSVNLSRWPFEPARWAFASRGVHARELMHRDCVVLDLCCGDGAYSYLFFSDIAARIDGVDNDSYAITYANCYHASPKIRFRKLDIISEPLPGCDYDVVVWNAAICYFTEDQLHSILKKVIAASKPTMRLSGMMPKANGWVDHKLEFSEPLAVESFFRRYFSTVVVRVIDEGAAITFYFQASLPLPA
jgi:SAM-dependent methyltransferase